MIQRRNNREGKLVSASVNFTCLKIPDVVLIEGKAFGDERGFFMEMYKRSEFTKYGITQTFVQDNHSHSVRGVLRGLHYQKQPATQAKVISVIRGEVFDVAVDIRKGSPTYGRWVSEILSQRNHRMLYVPEGFAHGFLVLSEVADVVYKVTSEYSPQDERGIIWNDPSIGIDWPIKEPLLVGKDTQFPVLKEADNNFIYQS